MKQRIASTGAMAALATCLLSSAPVQSEGLTAGADETVLVRELVATPDQLQGSLRNLSEAELRDVRLLVTHSFLWAREQTPGEVSPGRSEIYRIPGPIPPYGTVVFKESIVPPLPQRSDGRFDSTISVLGFTEVGP